MSGYTIAGFSLPYIASKEDAQQHVADFKRTRIDPGADPRVAWETGHHHYYRSRQNEPMNYESLHDRPRSAYVHRHDPYDIVRSELLVARRPSLRYVPLDVCRWRDPEHRAALIARARAHAALVPGCRATMPKESLCAA